MRSYLFVFETGRFDRQGVVDAIDDIPAIVNWYAFMPNAISLASEATAKEISEEIRRALPGINFIVTQLDSGEKGGWLRKSVWQFMNDPKAVDTSKTVVEVSGGARRRSA